VYYSSFGALALLITLIIHHNVLAERKNADAPSPKLRYKRFLLCVITYYLSDILWGFLYERHLTGLVFADTVLYFASMGLSVLLWTIYVVDFLDRKTVLSRILIVVGWAMLLFMLVSLVITLFVPFMFFFDAEQVYHPGDARYIALAAQIALFLTASVYSLSASFQTEGTARRHYQTIVVSGVVMTVFIVLQTCYPFAPFYAIGCLIATCTVHAFIMEDERQAYSLQLGSVTQKAYTDPLTGVKNVNAYAEAKTKLDARIADGSLTEFAVVVFDLNGLKETNDTKGHDAGDRYLRDACGMICRCFAHSPVYRIGGDEFVAILEGDDYRNRTALVEAFDRQIDDNRSGGGIVVVASGVSEFLPGTDAGYERVFERADRKMYARKENLKAEALHA